MSSHSHEHIGVVPHCCLRHAVLLSVEIPPCRLLTEDVELSVWVFAVLVTATKVDNTGCAVGAVVRHEAGAVFLKFAWIRLKGCFQLAERLLQDSPGSAHVHSHEAFAPLPEHLTVVECQVRLVDE